MKSRAELIEISGVLDTKGSYCPFYEFASNYIQGMKEHGNKEQKSFFETIKLLGDNPSEANGKAMGLDGKSPERIKEWCSYIYNVKELRDLSLNELHYVIGYCARRAKIPAK